MKIDKLRQEDFYFPILVALEELGGSGQVEEINNRVFETIQLDYADLAATYEKSGSSMATHKIAFGRTYLREAGLLKSEGKGLWVLTETGREQLALGEKAVREWVAEAWRVYNKNYNLAKAAKKKAASADAPFSSEPVEGVPSSTDADSGEWADQLLTKLQSMDPFGFERLSQRLLRTCGFIQVEVTKKSGDGGIDGKGVVRVNLVSFHVLFQCKRYQGSVGAGTVRDFRGAMQGRADKGLIITTGTFTPDARKEATRDGAPAIDLIDGQALCQLLKDNELGVSVEMVEQVSIDPAFFDEV